jgi:hypothetical protein
MLVKSDELTSHGSEPDFPGITSSDLSQIGYWQYAGWAGLLFALFLGYFRLLG